MGHRDHWETVYRSREPDRLSWHRAHLDRSIELLRMLGLSLDASIIDVGGGSSTFVDDLLDLGFVNVTVLDIAENALRSAKRRLGERASQVVWLAGDVTAIELPEHEYDLWHDRAFFHFLTDEGSRRRYVAAVLQALKQGGHVIVATFGPAGPQRCSGLPVMRYAPESLEAAFGPEFRTVASATEIHMTPSGAPQEFVYCCCRLSA